MNTFSELPRSVVLTTISSLTRVPRLALRGILPFVDFRVAPRRTVKNEESQKTSEQRSAEFPPRVIVRHSSVSAAIVSGSTSLMTLFATGRHATSLSKPELSY